MKTPHCQLARLYIADFIINLKYKTNGLKCLLHFKPFNIVVAKSVMCFCVASAAHFLFTELLREEVGI